jgi:hypothetical protein
MPLPDTVLACCCDVLMNFLSKDWRFRELWNVDTLDAARAAR